MITPADPGASSPPWRYLTNQSRKMAPKSDSGVKIIPVPEKRAYKYALVDIDRLIPDPENPRIAIQESSLDTILALVHSDTSGMYTLAEDMLEMGGTNPAELLSVSPVGRDFLVKEGNRRIAVRRLLRNPEQLRGQGLDSSVSAWVRLSQKKEARELPGRVLVVIGSAEDQDKWVDRKHLGPQDGRGPIPWDTQGKARRLARKTGTLDKTTAVIEGLKAHDPKRFGSLEPPKGTITTFSRVLDSSSAQAHIGIDTDESGSPVLSKGERSIRLLEEVLRDLRKSGKDKLTSRRIHKTTDIDRYLRELDTRIGRVHATSAITLTTKSSPPSAKKKSRQPQEKDVLKLITRPAARRAGRIYDELKVARRYALENASIVLVRVLLELSIADYAKKHSLPIASDEDPSIKQIVKDFREEVGRAQIQVPREISRALNDAATQPPSLSSKIEAVIAHLMAQQTMDRKEGQAKQREVRTTDLVSLLNDAVHRTNVVPSMARADHILEVLTDVLNAIVV